ncbi:hypothetical protein [Desulfurobacterium sp.]
MKVKRAIVFEFSRLTEEQEIILKHLAYHAGRLWNQVVRIKIYRLNEGISESLQYAGIGVEGGVNLPEGIRAR